MEGASLTLAEARRTEIVVGLDHRLESIFISPAAAIGIGVKTLHQSLVLCFYLLGRSRFVKTQGVKGLEFRVANRPPCFIGWRAARLSEQAVWIAGSRTGPASAPACAIV